MDPNDLRAEVTELLSRLIRANTTNPPGNETLAVEVLRDYLESNGITCEIYARSPDRANLVARLPGSGGGPSLLLLGHTDVVGVNANEWSVEPFSGEVRDGEIWGRGAIDMKSMVAAEAVALASLTREGFEPKGDLVFAAVADEEAGTGYGLRWLCEAHPEAVRTDYAVNEGGGDRLKLGTKAVYLCANAEKVTTGLRIRVRGRAGHASVPGIADNALISAAHVIERLAEFRAEPRLSTEVEAFLVELAGKVPPAAEALNLARGIDQGAAEVVEPLLGPTFSPTMISASDKGNVIPGSCDIYVDCRMLPGQSAETVEPIIRAQLGEDVSYELAWEEAYGGTRSPHETPLWTAIESFVTESEPGARMVPLICPAFTDSHWVRAAFGTVAYGFFPARAMSRELIGQLVHSADERIAIDDLELGLTFLRHVVVQLLA